jgi:hypothetical protein
MKNCMLIFICIFPLILCYGQQEDTIDLSRIIDLSKQTGVYRRIPNNSISLELAGHLNLLSLNYERIFFHAHDFYLSGRIGAGYIPPTISTFSFLEMVNGIYRVSKVLFLELGVGLNLTYTFWQDYNGSEGMPSDTLFHQRGAFVDPLITAFAGIRIQKKKGFLFRLGFTPLVELTDLVEKRTVYKQIGTTNSFLLWAGISFGYSF